MQSQKSKTSTSLDKQVEQGIQAGSPLKDDRMSPITPSPISGPRNLNHQKMNSIYMPPPPQTLKTHKLKGSHNARNPYKDFTTETANNSMCESPSSIKDQAKSMDMGGKADNTSKSIIERPMTTHHMIAAGNHENTRDINKDLDSVFGRINSINSKDLINRYFI